MNIILYSTGCPKCNILITKMRAKGIYFKENNNIDEMEMLGINEVPVLAIDNKLLSFAEANNWINS